MCEKAGKAYYILEGRWFIMPQMLYSIYRSRTIIEVLDYHTCPLQGQVWLAAPTPTAATHITNCSHAR
jgi:hypothetical protein